MSFGYAYGYPVGFYGPYYSPWHYGPGFGVGVRIGDRYPVAAHAQATVLEAAAFQIRCELLLHVLGQSPARGDLRTVVQRNRPEGPGFRVAPRAVDMAALQQRLRTAGVNLGPSAGRDDATRTCLPSPSRRAAA